MHAKIVFYVATKAQRGEEPSDTYQRLEDWIARNIGDATLTATVGFWQGTREPSYTVTVLREFGDSVAWARRIAQSMARAFDQQCVAFDVTVATVEFITQ